jgi:hypothetical protein
MMDAQLRSWATIRQLEYLDAVEQHGSETKAAKALGIHQRTLQRSLRSLEARAAQKSASQHQDVNRIPDGFAITGASTLTKTSDGLQWIKTAADKERQGAGCGHKQQRQPVQLLRHNRLPPERSKLA